MNEALELANQVPASDYESLAALWHCTVPEVVAQLDADLSQECAALCEAL